MELKERPDIKERTRERMELRIHADETMRTAIQWMQAVKPTEWLPAGKEMVVSEDEIKRAWRDHIDKSSQLIAKLWIPMEQMVDDLTAYMEVVCAKPKSPPQS